MRNAHFKYYSTNLKSPSVSFSEALLRGLAPDGGLYMPEVIPSLTEDTIRRFSSSEYWEIASAILSRFVGDDIDISNLTDLCRNAYDFSIPVEKVFLNNYILRLDQGPTASFKDFAARIMAKLMNYFVSLKGVHITVLTATSGDTGSAVANAFYGLGNINVVVLFPLKEVTNIQRKQMTTLNKNISTIAVEGKFDDCQKFVKQAFLDPALSDLSLSSANSINIGRLLPQAVYYFYAWSRITGSITTPVVFSVPSGNYGNLMGGIIAREMGLPVIKYVIAANENNEVTEFLKNGKYNKIVPSIDCISNAMNVGHPSNLARIVAFYGGMMDELGTIIKDPDIVRMRNDLFGVSLSDSETRSSMHDSYKSYNIFLEPHGAVAWESLRRFKSSGQNMHGEDQICISLETAHPAKFIEEVKSQTGISPDIPEKFRLLEDKPELFSTIDNNYEEFRQLLLKLNNKN